MSQIDDTIATYLTALAVEGKRPRTIESYDETLRAFRRAGHELALPDAIEDYTVEHAYAFLGDIQARGASAAYRNRRHREVRAFFSWCQKMGRLDCARGRHNSLDRRSGRETQSTRVPDCGHPPSNVNVVSLQGGPAHLWEALVLWVVHAGELAEPEQHALEEGRVYATWCRLGHDLSALRSQDELHDVLASGYPDWSRDQTVNYASHLWLFAHEIEAGDWIVVPSDRGRTFHIGEIVGAYEYDEAAEDPYRHSLELSWVAQAVPRSKFDVDLRHAFGGFKKVFRAHRNDAEARLRAMAVTEGWRSPPVEAGLDVESAPVVHDPLDRKQFEDEQTAELIFRRLRRAWSVAKSGETE